MPLWSRLVALLMIVVVGPVAGAIVAGRVLADRQATAVADARLDGTSASVRIALDAQATRVRSGLTGAVALRAVTDVGSSAALRRLRVSSGLDYLVVIRRGAVVKASRRTGEFGTGIHVTPKLLAGSPARVGLVSDRHVSVLDRPSSEVWGGLYRDGRFLRALRVPAITVGRGRAVASTENLPASPARSAPFGAGGPFAFAPGWRALCVCTDSQASGVLVLASRPTVGVLPPLHPATLAIVVVALVAGLALAFGLAKMVSRPIQRLAEDADASLRDELRMLREELDEWDAVELDRLDEQGRTDEISRIGRAFRAMRSGLRHTADQLGGSREELKQARDQLSDKERLSLSDSLTGVWNRRYLDMALSDAMQRGRRMGHSFSILMVDIDRFKLVNDGFGHQVGDDILVELCRRIGGALRTHLDVVVRYGGEEFVVLLPETGPAGARVVAEKIRHIIRMDPFSSGDTRVNVTVSIGVASFPDDGPDADQVLAMADANMYRAKRAGRDRVTSGPSASPRGL